MPTAPIFHLVLVILHCCISIVTSSSDGTATTLTSHQISAVYHNEHLLRVALGVEDYRQGSLSNVLDDTLFPRPSRLHRRSNVVASRHHVEYPVNVHIADDGSNTMYVASFRANQVFRISSDGKPELFARGTYCNTRSPCTVLSGPWGLVTHQDKLYVSSFSTDQILIFNTETSQYIDVMGCSEELNAPEGLSIGPSGKYLYVASFLSGEIVRYSIQERKKVNVVASSLPGPEGISFLTGSSSTLLAVACHTDHSIRLIDVGIEALVQLIEVQIAEVDMDGEEVLRLTSSSGSSSESSSESSSGNGGSWSHPVGVSASRLNGKDILFLGGHSTIDNKSDVLVAFEIKRPNCTFQQHNSSCTEVTLAAMWHAGMPELKGPSGIAISGDSIFVASYQSHRILAYEMNETLEEKLKLKASIRL